MTLGLARSVGARITFLLAVEPFHVFASEINRISNLREEYTKQIWDKAGAISGRPRRRPWRRASPATRSRSSMTGPTLRSSRRPPNAAAT
nr:hypothetical protein [Methylobrevis pamukkalensis]